MTDPAPPPRRILAVALGGEGLRVLAERVASMDPRGLVLAFEDGVPGVYSDYDGPVEVHRCGRPARSTLAFFDILDPAPGEETSASVVLRRMAYARRATDILVVDPRLQRLAAHAFADQWYHVWLGTQRVPGPEMARLGAARFGSTDWAEWEPLVRASLAQGAAA